MPKQFKVIRTDFEHLENLLNEIVDVNSEYSDYYIYQILAEHCYDGALAVVILTKGDLF